MRSRYSKTAFAGFDLVFGPWMRRRLHRIEVRATPPLPDDRPLVLVANHTSWWDGFLLRELQQQLRADAPFYTVMLARELARFRMFRLMGALPLDPESPASLRTLLRRLNEERARSPRMVVAYFPQGRLWPSSRRPLGFRTGVRGVVRAVAPAVVLPVGLHLEPHNHPAPTAYVVPGEPLLVNGACDVRVVEERVENALDGLHAALVAPGAPEQLP